MIHPYVHSRSRRTFSSQFSAQKNQGQNVYIVLCDLLLGAINLVNQGNLVNNEIAIKKHLTVDGPVCMLCLVEYVRKFLCSNVHQHEMNERKMVALKQWQQQTFTHEIFRTLRRCSAVLHGEISTKNKGGSLEETLHNLNFLFLSLCVYLFKNCHSQFLSH